jgi:hypothetical protein
MMYNKASVCMRMLFLKGVHGGIKIRVEHIKLKKNAHNTIMGNVYIPYTLL